MKLEIEKFPEFDGHKFVSFVFDKKSGLRGVIAIHRGGLTSPAMGATRLWGYSSEADAISDALRLSKIMSYKSALAGVKYGGAKAVLIGSDLTPKKRKELCRAYAKRINYLNGKFITGTDVGLEDDDVKIMRKETPYIIGTRVDPALYTAIGVVNGIQACLKKVFGKESIKNHSFAIQGLGKTGFRILKILYRDTKKIYIADIDSKKITKAKKMFPEIKVVPPAKIYKENVDVFVPCALSGVLNSETVSELHTKIIAGSANNQLKSDDIGNLLHKLGILYAPDYVINSGGLISVVDEFENENPNDKRINKKVLKLKTTLKKIFAKSKKQDKATNIIANEMAEKIFNNKI